MFMAVLALALVALLTNAAAQHLQEWRPSLHLHRASVFIDRPEHTVSTYRLSREILQARWDESWNEDLPCNGPKLKGSVHKTGVGSQSPTLRLKPGNEQIFTQDRLPIYMGCQVFISEKWRFLFVRQPKSSSTAVLSAIKTQLCGLPDGTGDCAKEDFRIASDEDLTVRVWQDYFVFTFVRNPWTRLLSAYHMFNEGFLHMREGENGTDAGDACGLPFEAFTEDTNSMRALCPNEQCCSYIRQFNRWKPEFLDEHIGDQSHCVFLPGGESIVDFIGATESIDEDWNAVVALINEHTGLTFEAGDVSNPNGHGSQETGGVQNACTLDKVRTMLNETRMYHIASQYSMDVINFGYL